MGVKELWSIIAPVQRHLLLKDLAGQTLAVDLSIWVCETQAIKQMQGIVIKPYLRNLFFRVSHMVELGVKLVFAIEGKAPEIKRTTMIQRQNSNPTCPSRKNSEHATRSLGRSRFNGILKECCELLDLMGVPYVQSDGEAEQMCAWLNRNGLVDACVTDDGDAFLYGATVVYRNFTMNTKDPHVEMYRSEEIERDIGLTRDKMVALALLLGCDYLPVGVPGVGRELALKMLRSLDGADVLKVFENWKTDVSLSKLEVEMKRKVSHCTVCKHPGSRHEHVRGACSICALPHGCHPSNVQCACVWHESCKEGKKRHAEMCVRKKALRIREFPQQKVIREFLRTNLTLPKRPFLWKRPRLQQFMLFAKNQMTWVEEYSLAKLLPLLTLHDMKTRLAGSSTTLHLLNAHCIVKRRTRQMVPCYEVQWHKMEDDDFTEADYYTTLETQDLFQQCFPHLVTQFDETQDKKKKRGKSKVKVHTKEISDAEEHHAKTCSSVDLVNFETENLESPRVRSPDKAKLDRERQPFAEIAVNSRNLTSDRPEFIARHRAFKTTFDHEMDDTDDDDDDDKLLPLSERLARNRIANELDKACVSGEYSHTERVNTNAQSTDAVDVASTHTTSPITTDLNEGIEGHAGSSVNESSFWEPMTSISGVSTEASEQLDFVADCFSSVPSSTCSAIAVMRDCDAELDQCQANLSGLRLTDERVLPSSTLVVNHLTAAGHAVVTPRRKLENYIVSSPDLFDSSFVLTPGEKKSITPSVAYGRFDPANVDIATPAFLARNADGNRLNLNERRLPLTPHVIDDSMTDCGHFEIQTSLLDVDEDYEPPRRKSVLWDSPANSPAVGSPLCLMERLKRRNANLFCL